MKYELLIENEDMTYISEAGADTLAEIVAMREESPRRTVIFQRLDPVEVYAEVARQKYGPPVYPAPDAAFAPRATTSFRPGQRTGDIDLTEKELELLQTPPVVRPGPDVPQRGVYEAQEVRGGE